MLMKSLGEGWLGRGGGRRGRILTKRLEENRTDRKQKRQPMRSKSDTKYTACSLDSVFLQKEKEEAHDIGFLKFFVRNP